MQLKKHPQYCRPKIYPVLVATLAVNLTRVTTSIREMVFFNHLSKQVAHALNYKFMSQNYQNTGTLQHGLRIANLTHLSLSLSFCCLNPTFATPYLLIRVTGWIGAENSDEASTCCGGYVTKICQWRLI